MPRTGRLLWLAPLVAVAGCGSTSEADRIRGVLDGYAKAFAARDYQAICDRYFAPQLSDGVERNAGLPCESAIRPAIAETRKPTLKVRSVTVQGGRATARVHTAAANQPPSDDTIALVKVDGGWRIASLATAGPQPAGP